MGKTAWHLEKNERTQRLYLNIPAGLTEEQYPAYEDILAAAKAHALDERYLLRKDILEHSLQKALSLIGDEYALPVEIEQGFDARLIISPDKIRANLYIRKSRDAHNPLDMKLISTVLTNSHLKNLDTERIKKDILAFRDSPAMELADYLLCEGVAPGRGPDRETIPDLEWIEGEEKERVTALLRAYTAKKGTVKGDTAIPPDDKETQMAFVRAGHIMYVISPPEPGSPGTDVYGKTLPGLPGNDPLIRLFENVSLSPGGIRAEKDGIALAKSIYGALYIRVVSYREGSLKVSVSKNRMEAFLEIDAERGAGTPVTLDMARALLEKEGITGNIDTQYISDSIQQVRTTRIPQTIRIVEGLEPVKAGGARIQWFRKPDTAKKGCQVNADERILSITRFPSGANGINVFGEEIAASTALDVAIPEHDPSIREETVSGNQEERQFFAAVSGELHLDNNKLYISDTREITGDVGPETGNIDFPGNLVLYGNVNKGFAAKAHGTLTLSGDASASLVSAEISVMMSGGIRGAGKGTVWAKQAISIGFAENARLLAGHDITIDKYCFQTIVKTNSRLIINGSPGVLLGGSVRASKGVEVVELGSPKTIRTTISFGQNYLVSDQIEVCEKEAAQIKEMVNRINSQMQKIPPTDPRIHDLRKKKLELLKRNDKLTVRIFTLNEQFETHILSHIRVEKTVHPGVILESHGRYYEVREPRSHVIFSFDQITGQITCNPIPDNEE